MNIYSSRHYDTDEALYSDFTEATGITGQPHRGHARGADRPDAGRGRQQPGRHLPDRRRRPHLARRQGRPAAAGAFRGAERAHPRAPAPPGRPLVRPVAAGAGDLLRQGPGAEPAADLRGAGRSGLQGPDLHPLLVERLQPVADVLDDRQRRRGGGEGLGRGAARQPRPRARGRRQRPDQGGGLGRVRHRGGEHLLLLPRHRERGGRASSRASTTSAWSSRTRSDRGTHVNIAAAGVAAHAPHPDAAISFLEYLATPEAQAYFADQNYEYPGRRRTPRSPRSRPPTAPSRATR